MSRIEGERRLAEVEHLARTGLARSVVVSECARRFGMSATTTDEYLKKVREQWATDGAASRDTERERAIGRLRDLSLKAEKRGAYSAAVNAERLAADILGLKSPARVDVRASSETSLPNVALDYEHACEELSESVTMLAGCVASGSIAPTHAMRALTLELLRAIDGRLSVSTARNSGPP